MAQLVEQRIRNAWVAGSSRARGSFQHYLCGISTSVVHGLPKPGRRVRFPYPALFCLSDMGINNVFLLELHTYYCKQQYRLR